MISKIYEKCRLYIKENFKILCFLLVLFLFLTVKLPYYISSPGGLLNTADKVFIDSDFKMKGSLNMAYVSEARATVPLFLYAKINPDWDVSKIEDVVSGNEKVEDMEYRNKLLLKEANDLAVLVAYKYSNIPYTIDNNKFYVTYIDDEAKTDLKVGDRLIKVNNFVINKKQELYDFIASKNIGDVVSFTVVRNGKEKKVKAKLIDVLGVPKVGAIVTETMDVNSNYNVKLKFKGSESGSSGGMMMALTVYSYLNKVDLTSGKTIVGTGTIDGEGNVGSISGVKYKLIGAVSKKADVFFVPAGDNYKEAKKIAEEKKYDIDIVSVKKFDEVLKYLMNDK